MKTRRRISASNTVGGPARCGHFPPSRLLCLRRSWRQDGSATALRDLALFRVGVDSMLRSSDLVAPTVAHVAHDGEIVGSFATRQKKQGIRSAPIYPRKHAPSSPSGWPANPEFGPASRDLRDHDAAASADCENSGGRSSGLTAAVLLDALDPPTKQRTCTPRRKNLAG